MHAVIVLGAAVWPGGVASPTLRRRAEAGAAVFLRSEADWLVLTGGAGRHPPAEAEVAAEIARVVGIPAERLIQEDRSTRTVENLAFARDLLAARGCHRATIVSDGYHLPRALLAARLLGLQATAAAAPDPRGERRGLALKVAREALALPATAFQAWRWR
ncbi:MAG: ElyC/SanA/YdcF family protein [Pseudomonadota bacterium]